jgi:HlyD family secretion protein
MPQVTYTTARPVVFLNLTPRILGILGSAALLAVGVLYAFAIRPGTGDLASPGPVKVIGVSAWGRLSPSSEVISLVPAANSDGARVESLLVQEGDEVTAGQPVAILATSARREAALRESQARLEVARARLEQVKQGSERNDIRAQESVVRRLEFDLDNTRRQFHRIDGLFKRGASTDEERDNSEWKLRQNESLLDQSRAQLDRLKVVRPADLLVAEAEVAQARAAVRVAEEDLAATKVSSPFGGVVLRIHTRPGQRIAEEGIVDLGATQEMHAVAEVYEEDIGRVRTGMKATVRVPGLDWQGKGEVISMSRVVSRKVIFSNDPVADTDARVVETRIRLQPDDSKKVNLLSNARVEVVIDAP